MRNKNVKDLLNKSVMSANNMGFDTGIVVFDDSSALTLYLRNTMLINGQNRQVNIESINGSTVTKAEQNGTQIILTFDDDIRVHVDSRESTLI